MIDDTVNDRLRLCRLLVLDFDGVMTDNKVLVHDDGRESVTCNRADGMGLRYLRTLSDVKVLILSSEVNSVGRARAAKLGIDYIYAGEQKLGGLLREIGRLGVGPERVCYVGNDINDLECMKAVGLAVAVADSAAEVLTCADHVTSRNGGDGAIREVCDMMLRSRGALAGQEEKPLSQTVASHSCPPAPLSLPEAEIEQSRD